MEEARDPVAAGGGGADDVGAGKQITNEELKYVFKAGRDYFPAKPYCDDGNTDLYTNEALEAREALRMNPNVRQAINTFITNNFNLPNTTVKYISKDEYIKVFVQVGTILRPGLDTDQLMDFIRDDFDSDCQPKKSLIKKNKPSTGEDGENKPATQ